jgi:formylglycine-generating enzyme required for sulfatase activity
MKKIIFIFSVSCVSVFQSFANDKIPANVVLLDKNTNSYIDAHEVTIADWLIYLNSLKEIAGENSLLYQEALPNAEICQQGYKTAFYLTDPAFLNYPIVGITYDQARAYCGWRTDNENRNKKKSVTVNYIYYLPSESDLQNAYDLQEVKTSVKSLSEVNVNAKGLTGIADNARELTENKKVVTGAGSNGLRFETYTEANAMLGFRCKLILK